MISVNLIGYDNGAGLSRDMQLLADALHVAGGFEVVQTRLDGDRRGRGALDLRTRVPRLWARLRGHARRFDINLMLERVRPRFLNDARVNLLLANPDWIKPGDARLLGVLDAVLVKTQHARPLFAPLARRVDYVGFTSADRRLPDVRRERACFHLAGRSPYKGTQALLALWQAHPHWPRLTVLQHAQPVASPRAANIDYRYGFVDDASLRELQNAHAIHLCPSETEGFGHYLVEAMSCAALVVTTDAPPMNELVAPGRGVCVAWRDSERAGLATRYRFDVDAMTAAIERIVALPDAAIAASGAAARAWFEANDRAFRARIVEVLRGFA